MPKMVFNIFKTETAKDTVARQSVPLRMNDDPSIRNTLGRLVNMNNFGSMLVLAVALLLTFMACSQAANTPAAPRGPSTPDEPAGPSTPTPPEPTPTKPSDPRVETINPEGTALSNELYTLDLGTALAEVFVISTNTTTGDVTPTVERLDSDQRNEHASQPRPSVSQPVPEPVWFRDLQNLPPLRRSDDSADQRQRFAYAQSPVAEGDRFVFIEMRDNEVLVPVPATARKVIRTGATTLAVWVANREWRTTCVFVEQCLTQEMVDALATRFLRPGSGNDIYDWVTAIFGAPWGPHSFSYLIPPEAAAQVHILLLDIEGDGAGSTAGFFATRHNFQRDPAHPILRASAERLIFFIDSASLSIPEGPTWEVTDPAPSDILDTLAHEFQHMIHFYHKQVVTDLPESPASEAWLNEMASEMTTDLIADKLGIPGPRGVAYNDPTAGAARNTNGRLPLYNYWNEIQVTRWDNDLTNYSNTYALGAYLARNYGGAALFREIVQNDSAGVAAIEAALATLGHDVSFADVLTDWAAANLLSDDTGAPHPYRYNSGTWFTSTVGGQTFRLGSINLFNYRYEGEETDVPYDGPYLYRSLSEFTADPHPPHSNRYATLGRTSGTVRLRITAPAGNRITVVVK